VLQAGYFALPIATVVTQGSPVERAGNSIPHLGG